MTVPATPDQDDIFIDTIQLVNNKQAVVFLSGWASPLSTYLSTT